MASRLSEESLKAVLDAGHQALVIQNDRALDVLGEPDVDLEQLLLADDPEAAVQAVEPQRIHNALVRRGVEDALEILPLLSEEQVTRIFDYEAWNEDRLEPLKAVRWLNLFKEVGPEELYRRFRGLEEEFQLALLSPLIDMLDEEAFEKLSQEEQDEFNRLPCGTLFYKVKTPDPRIEEFVLGLVDASLDSDVAYAYSLLAHAAYVPPVEQEAMLAQFRKARLEEDGFVTYEESLKGFQTIDLEGLRRKWGFALHREPDAMNAYDASNGEPFLTRVLQSDTGTWTDEDSTNVMRGLAFLGNSLCAVAHIEPDDRQGLKRLLQQAQAMVSLGLEYVTGGDVRTAREVLKKEHAQALFRAGLTLVRRLAEAAIDRLIHHGLPDADKLRRQLLLDKRGVLELTLERSLQPLLGFERTETLKGLCNRFPVRPVAVDEDERGTKRVTFMPIASLAQLSELAASVDQITGLLHLASLTDDDVHADDWSLDRRLTTALARVLLGGEFRATPLGDADLQRLVDLPAEAAQAITGDFFAGVEGSLRLALAPSPGANGSLLWSASRKAAVPVADPAQGVMAELADLVLGLTAAREHARSQPVGQSGLSGMMAVAAADAGVEG